MEEIDKWKARFERERKARREAEQLLESKSLELFELNLKLEQEIQSKGSQLIEQEELFASIFHASMDGIVLANKNARVIEVNKSAQRMLGYSREQLIGRRVINLVSKENISIAYNSFMQALQTGYCKYESDLIRSDGTLFPAEVVGSRTEVGGKQVVQGIIRDVTPRIRTLNELKQARDEAEKANAAKSLFLATMSHEIRTPLNGILGFTKLVLSGQLTEDQRNNLKLVNSSGDNLLQIINDLLDFSRIESGQMILEDQAYDLKALLIELHTLHSSSARQKKIHLDLNFSANFPLSVRGDQTRVRQIIHNLLSNAIKFTEQGSVEICAQNIDQELKISVIDTGIGFDECHTEFLFEAFSQADASTTRRYGGTGLGLAICQRLAGAMNGRIDASSRKNVGSTFSLTIPFTKAALKAEGTSINMERKSTPTGHNILIAEDQNTNARLLVLMLKRLGYESKVVTNGEEVLAELRENQNYAAILMDRHMRILDGVEATRKIRQGEVGESIKDIPIIAVTASAMPADQNLCIDAGMNGFLAKPLFPEDLESALKSLL